MPDELHASLKARGSGAKGWANSWTEVEYLGDGKFAASIGVGHRVFKDKTDGQWKKHKITNKRPIKDYVLIQSAKCCVEVYPTYAKYFDVDHEEVRLHEERWVVQRLRQPQGDWRDVGAWNPVIDVEEGADFIKVAVTYETDYGPFTVEYLQRDGAALKHNVYFTNESDEEETFRVQQKWAGIVGEKCNGQDFPLETSEVVLNFHQADKTSKEFMISENLWSMMFNPDGSEKEDQCLQIPIAVEEHAQGMKADFIYSSWVLTQGKSLEIDPDTATLNNPTIDGDIAYNGTTYNRSAIQSDLDYQERDTPSPTHPTMRVFVEWSISGIPNDATITDTIFKYHGKTNVGDAHIHEMLGCQPSGEADDEAGNAAIWTEAAEGTVYVDPAGFPVVGENKQVDLGANADSDLEDQLTAGDWFAIGITADANLGAGDMYSEDRSIPGPAVPPPTLYVEYTVVVVPTVTTQAADDIGIGAGTLNGTITATGGENCGERGFDYDYDSGAPYANEETDTDSFGTGVFEEALSGLTQGVTVYFRAKAQNTAGWGYGDELNFRTLKANTGSASAGFGAVAVTGRSLTLGREATGVIGAVGTTDRSLVLTRSAVAALSESAVTGRLIALARFASASESIIGVTDRALTLSRSATAAIGVAGVVSRIIAISRNATAAIGVAGVTSRVIAIARFAVATISSVATSSRVKGAVRSASASFSSVAQTARSLVLSRTATAAIGVAGVTSRVIAIARFAVSTISSVATTDRIIAITRVASASFSSVAQTSRSLVLSRFASASIGIVGITNRILTMTRSAVAAISSVATTSRIIGIARYASAAIGSAASTSRSLVLSRYASASASLIGTTDRAITIARYASAAIGNVATTSRSLALARFAQASAGIVATNTRVIALIRSASASFSLVGITDRALTLMRTATASISSVAVTARSLVLARYASASASIVATNTRVIALIRSTTAAIGIVAIASQAREVIMGIITLKFANKLLDLNIGNKIKKLILGTKEN